MRKAAWGWLGLAAVVIGLDQLTKLYVDTHLTYGQTLPVFRGLNWVLAYNPGAAFSFLADAGGWQRFFFAALALGVSAWLGWLIVRGRESTAMNLAAARMIHGELLPAVKTLAAALEEKADILDPPVPCEAEHIEPTQVLDALRGRPS